MPAWLAGLPVKRHACRVSLAVQVCHLFAPGKPHGPPRRLRGALDTPTAKLTKRRGTGMLPSQREGPRASN